MPKAAALPPRPVSPSPHWVARSPFSVAELADGFGINCQEFQVIVGELGTELDIPKDRMDALAEDVFRSFDTDDNDLIDALEFLVAGDTGRARREPL